MGNLPKVTVPHRIGVVRATRAETDEQLLQSWLKSLSSPHTRRNFETTARRVLAELPMGLRSASVEDVREALEKVTHGVGKTTRTQYVLRVKSLLGYTHKVGYTPFNAGAVIKVKLDSAHRGATLAKRIITETEIALLIRAAPSKRDRVLLEVATPAGSASPSLWPLLGPTCCLVMKGACSSRSAVRARQVSYQTGLRTRSARLRVC